MKRGGVKRKRIDRAESWPGNWQTRSRTHGGALSPLETARHTRLKHL
jgi:hypothetical protein